MESENHQAPTNITPFTHTLRRSFSRQGLFGQALQLRRNKMKILPSLAFVIALAWGCDGTNSGTSGKTSTNETETSTHIDKNGNSLISGRNLDLHGIVVVTGYFCPFQRGRDNDYGITFNDFIVTDAPSLFFSHYRHLIDIGNTINRLYKGQLAIGLDFETCPQFENAIKSSTITEPVRMVLEIPEPRGTESNTYFNIKSVMRLK